MARYQMTPPTTEAEATKAWGKFRHKIGTRCKCLDEQFGLCGYSEISIDNKYPIINHEGKVVSRLLGAHLEHVEPKSSVPSRTFDHSNLIISAIDDIKARSLLKQDVFGGHHKLKRYSETSFVSPLWKNCRDYFYFESSTGKVIPNSTLPNRREKAKARLTIYILNLNAPILVNLRKIWLKQLDELILSATSTQELHDLAELELSPINGTLRPFHSAQRQILGKIGNQICQTLGI